MESKYYTPTIEEFYVGFEFQFETGIEGWKTFGFNKNKATQLFQNVEDFNTQFRVKYLDKEDIESLGWKFIPKQSAGKQYYEKDGPNGLNGDLVMEHDFLNNKITIKYPNYIRDGSGRYDGFVTIVNNITIFNKSEFKKLMKQIRII